MNEFDMEEFRQQIYRDLKDSHEHVTMKQHVELARQMMKAQIKWADANLLCFDCGAEWVDSIDRSTCAQCASRDVVAEALPG